MLVGLTMVTPQKKLKSILRMKHVVYYSRTQNTILSHRGHL
jgi:hypothetical protein